MRVFNTSESRTEQEPQQAAGKPARMRPSVGINLIRRRRGWRIAGGGVIRRRGAPKPRLKLSHRRPRQQQQQQRRRQQQQGRVRR